MNKIHPKIAVAITALLILLSSCQNDDNLSNPTNKKEGQLRTSKILRGKDAEAAIAMYHEQIGKARLKNQGMMLKSGDDFTLDEAEVMVVENKRNGKINYTYHVNHSRDSKTTFFNVVITEWRGFKKLMLFEYEMTQDFSSKYSFGETNFSNFDGLLHVNVLNADDDFPCDDSPGGGIPFTGGVGTSSGGGSGGSGENQDGGNPHSEFFLRQLFTIAHMSSSYKAPTNNNNGGGSDGGGDDDEHIIHRSPRDFNYHLSVPASNDTSNPCGESEEIGILNPVEIIRPQQLCNDLKAKSQDPNFASLMNGLKAKAGTQNFESAYTMYQVSGVGLSFSPEFTGSQNVANGRQVSLQIQLSSTLTTNNASGFIHCHLDNGTTFKIFSYSDVIALAQITKLSNRPTAELAVYVTTASGTFAMKVNNRNGLKNKADYLDSVSKAREIDFKNYVDINKPILDQIKGFLQFMNDKVGNEINLYQQFPNGDWKQLELNQHGQLIATNC